MKPIPIVATCLAELDSQTKARMPVSMAITPDGRQITVSNYEDEVWNFWPYIPRENAKDGEKRIIWGIALPDGTKLTDERHRRLLESSKDFIWSLHVDPIDGSKRPSMKTLISSDAQIYTCYFIPHYLLSNKVMLGEGNVSRIEVRLSHKDGRNIPVEIKLKRISWEEICWNRAEVLHASNPPFVIFAFIKDISKRRRVENDLIETNARLETLIEAIPDPIFMKDGDGRWLVTNSAAKDLFHLHSIDWQNRESGFYCG